MMASEKEARARTRARDAQVGLPARRASVELLAAVLQKKQPLDDLLGRSLDKGSMFDLPQRDRALTRAIVAASLRRKGQLDHVLGSFLERGTRACHRRGPSHRAAARPHRQERS